MEERVRIELKNGVADLRMVRVDKLNALDSAMFDGLIEAGRTLTRDPAVRAVVLSGEGRGFCAGLDLANFAAMAGGPKQGTPREPASELLAKTERPANRAQLAACIWQEVPVPVIAAVHGVAFGGGFQIALGADLRIVAPDARMSLMEIQWGLIPDMAGTQSLRRLVPLDVAKELTWTGRIFDGDQAVKLGLALRTSLNPRDDALALARELAQKSPDAIRAGKQLLNEAYAGTFVEGLALEEKLQRSLLGKPNQLEAVKASLEKRAARFMDGR